MTTMPISIPRGSDEYVGGSVAASVPLDMTVELSLTRGSDPHAWLPAVWVGDVGTTRTAHTADPVTFDDSYPFSAYTLYARLTDTPEEPIIRVGLVYISGSTDAPVLVPVGSTAGSALFAIYAGGWAVRPTNRTDVIVVWIGGDEAHPPPGALLNDIWLRAA